MAVESGMPVEAQKPPVEYETYWGRVRSMILVSGITLAYGLAMHWELYLLTSVVCWDIGYSISWWIARRVFGVRIRRQPFWSHFAVDVAAMLPFLWMVGHQEMTRAFMRRLFRM